MAKNRRISLPTHSATAQPVAYICVECGALWRKVRLPGDADESWNMISVKGCAGCDNGPKPLLDALYREPLPAPATVDAAAVRGAVRRIVRDAARAGAIDAPDDKNYSGFTENDASRCAERVLESMEDDIAALPLPAPATAVEEARGAVSSLAFARRVLVATLLDHDEIVCGDWRIECELDPANLTERFAFSTPKGETMYDTAEEAVDALLAAEAADEGHTLAAKESRSDDRPAKGQGGGRG